jgi:N utilization substance protein B
MGTRRKAREIALQILYQLDVQEQLSEEQGLSLFWRNFGAAAMEAQPGAPAESGADEAQPFAEQLVRGVRLHLAELDALISASSRNWRLERMARVDRNLLRLAVYELKFADEVPAKVAINEAIEIAKRYGTAESPAFVNGILDRCREELGKV